MLNRGRISGRWIDYEALIIGAVGGKSEQAVEAETACLWSSYAERDKDVSELAAIAQQMSADNRAERIPVFVGTDTASQTRWVAELRADPRDADGWILGVGSSIADDIVLKGETGVIYIAMKDVNLSQIQIPECSVIGIKKSTHGYA